MQHTSRASVLVVLVVSGCRSLHPATAQSGPENEASLQADEFGPDSFARLDAEELGDAEATYSSNEIALALTSAASVREFLGTAVVVLEMPSGVVSTACEDSVGTASARWDQLFRTRSAPVTCMDVRDGYVVCTSVNARSPNPRRLALVFRPVGARLVAVFTDIEGKTAPTIVQQSFERLFVALERLNDVKCEADRR
jgi:hypothetical protein